MAKKELSFNEKLLALSNKYKMTLDSEYLDSGSIIMNMVLGGGLPMCKNIEIYSNSGYGKSTIDLKGMGARNTKEKDFTEELKKTGIDFENKDHISTDSLVEAYTENYDKLMEVLSKYSDLGIESYNAAMDASKELDYKNSVKLGLALNLSVFYYEVLSNPTEACKIAKETLEKAKADLAGIDEEDEEYKDPISIINLLQENLNMWNMENEEAS